MSAKIVVLINDLLLGSKIRETLKALGREAVFVSASSGLASAALDADLVLADLSLRGDDPIPVVATMRAAGVATRVVAFYSHVDDVTRQRAVEAGVDEVLPRSQFFARLPEICK